MGLSPDEGASKYLYLGQLLAGEEAASNLGRGIELLAAQAAEVAQDPHGDGDELAAINRDIAEAFCSLAEVYLTDLWYAHKGRRTLLGAIKWPGMGCPPALPTLRVCSHPAGCASSVC